MAWLILLLLIPSVVVPVVLLWGFTGCKFEPTRGEPPLTAAPTGLQAVDIQADSITLSWSYIVPPEPVTFSIHRDGALIASSLPQSQTMFTNTGREPETAYHYQVSSVRNSDQLSSDRHPADPGLLVTTPPWESIFDTANVPPNPDNGATQANDCIVQRINGVPRGGKFVRITLRGISNATTVLTAVTVSSGVPAGSPQEYDSADQPQVLTFNGVGGVTLQNGEAKTSDKIRHDVAQGQDLLVALDVSAASGNILRRIVAGTQSFIGNNNAGEAAVMNRSAGYNEQTNRVFCIERIELA
jgi:hypothetical protein